MTYYSETKELIENKNVGTFSIIVKNRTFNDDLGMIVDNKVPESKRKVFKIPDHISSIECNYLKFYFLILISIIFI